MDAQKPQWTKAIPSKEGHYWFYGLLSFLPCRHPCLYILERDGEDWFIFGEEMEDSFGLELAAGYWLRIETPQLPEVK